MRQTHDDSLVSTWSIQIGTGHDRGTELLQTDFIAHFRQITFLSFGLFYRYEPTASISLLMRSLRNIPAV